MGISYIYKKIPPQDKAIIPFNAHKQYNYSSASAASNRISHFNTSYTSESVSIWSGNNGNDDGLDNNNNIDDNNNDDDGIALLFIIFLLITMSMGLHAFVQLII